MRTLATIIVLAGMLAGCSDYPRDMGGTSGRISTSHVIRIGLDSAVRPADAAQFIDRLETATGARAVLRRGSIEPLSVEVEEGALDLVIGHFADDSPAKTTISFIDPPIGSATVAGRTTNLRAAARNGENRWIMHLEQVARAGEGR